jgi:hypothetical protein
MKCTVKGCEKELTARGLCAMHYMRLRTKGSTDNPKPKPEKRFWSKVDKKSSDECWNWLAGSDGAPSNGINYGGFWIDGKGMRAHVFSYKLHKGKVPDGMVVMHICDNPRCVNPCHLKLGTQAENIQDAIAKGRFIQHKNRNIRKAKGSAHHNSKLTEDDVRSIRSDQFKTGTEAARQFGISVANACLIRKHKAWKHIT